MAGYSPAMCGKRPPKGFAGFAAGLLSLALLGGVAGCSGGADTVVNDPPPGTDPPGNPPSGDSGLDARPGNTSCLATVQPGSLVSVATARVFPNLTFTSPVLLIQAPGDTSTWYVVEQGGLVKSFANVESTSTVATVIDMRSKVRTAFEAGLLGMAFDPSFATNRRVYLSYTAPPTVGGAVLESRISRFTATGGTLDPASESILLTIPQPFENHNGGHVAFGPDGLLYAGFGDGGSGGDPQNNAQNRTNLLGKILRIDVSGPGAYAIPADNPYAATGARCQSGSSGSSAFCAEIYAYGLRNPWRWSFDRASATPDLWAGDVGQGAWEEVDRIQSGGNYGWRFREGAHCFNPATNCPTSANGAPLIDPVGEYPHTLGISITGGYVYRGSAIPDLVGRYVFGDFGSGRIFALMPGDSGTFIRQELLATGHQISSFAEGPDGELYYLNYGGTLHKLVPGAPAASPIPTRLSETGCVNPANPSQPAEGLIPYTPAAEFWSDGAGKMRWMALPNGTRITVEADGDWTFPAGTVLMKHFTLNGALIETRLFMRHTDTGNWGGYSYRWNDAGTDAIFVSGGQTATIGAQEWLYPSEAQCLQCHTNAAGGSLGLETRQLNSSITYPATGRTANQLATLQAIGLFANTPNVEAAYPAPGDTTRSLAERARSYLHTNCAQCHRPGGTTQSNLDLRFSVAMAATNTCDAPPASGDLGIADARVIAPGDPERSVLYLRMSRRDANQMPPLGSHLVDMEGAALLQQWIAGMGAGCE